MCKPEIEDGTWKGYDESYKVSGGFGLNKEDAYMICLTGEGCIYATTDGQRNVARERSIWLMEIEVSAVVVAGYEGLSPEQKEENAKYLYYYLRNEGWSKEAICGLFGNIDRESGFNPAAYNKMNKLNKAYGIVQWIPGSDAVNNLEYTVVNELALNNPKELMNMQLEYLLNHYTERWYPQNAQTYLNRRPLEHSTPTDLTFQDFTIAKNDVGDLALIFNATYERSGDQKEKLDDRVELKETWENFFKYYN